MPREVQQWGEAQVLLWALGQLPPGTRTASIDKGVTDMLADVTGHVLLKWDLEVLADTSGDLPPAVVTFLDLGLRALKASVASGLSPPLCYMASSSAGAAAVAAEPPPPVSSAPLVVIAGPPAAGKGTQCEKIKGLYGFVHLSTGDLLRDNVKQGTELGVKAKAFMDKGELVPSELIIDIVKARLGSHDVLAQGCLLDGFPRTADQAGAMVEGGLRVNAFLLIEVPDDDLVERGCGRRLDPETGEIYHLKFRPPPAEIAHRLVHRSDDQEDKIRTRLRAYHDQVSAILPYFPGVVTRVNGATSPDNVFAEIREALAARGITPAPSPARTGFAPGPRLGMRFFRATGCVQGVGFRRSLVRALRERGLQGGASNVASDPRSVDFTLQGDPAQMESFVSSFCNLVGGTVLSGGGATVEGLEELPQGRPREAHEITTDNVDNLGWEPEFPLLF